MTISVLIILRKLDNTFLRKVAQYELTSDEQVQLVVFLKMVPSSIREIKSTSEGVVTSTFGILEAWRHDTKATIASVMYDQVCGAYLELKKADVAEYIRSGEFAAKTRPQFIFGYISLSFLSQLEVKIN